MLIVVCPSPQSYCAQSRVSARLAEFKHCANSCATSNRTNKDAIFPHTRSLTLGAEGLEVQFNPEFPGQNLNLTVNSVGRFKSNSYSSFQKSTAVQVEMIDCSSDEWHVRTFLTSGLDVVGHSPKRRSHPFQFGYTVQ